MTPINGITTKGSAWKCAFGCLAVCLMDTVSPILDATGIIASTISQNA